MEGNLKTKFSFASILPENEKITKIKNFFARALIISKNLKIWSLKTRGLKTRGLKTRGLKNKFKNKVVLCKLFELMKAK